MSSSYWAANKSVPSNQKSVTQTLTKQGSQYLYIRQRRRTATPSPSPITHHHQICIVIFIILHCYIVILIQRFSIVLLSIRHTSFNSMLEASWITLMLESWNLYNSWYPELDQRWEGILKANMISFISIGLIQLSISWHLDLLPLVHGGGRLKKSNWIEIL